MAAVLLRLRASPGSRSEKSHQWWPGGFIDHVADGMQYLTIDYLSSGKIYPHPFALADGHLAFLLHDIEKPWKYVEPSETFHDKTDRQRFRERIIAQYKFNISDEVMNAIEYAEGEHHNYVPGQRTMLPLASFVHRADIWSAREHFDKPGTR